MNTESRGVTVSVIIVSWNAREYLMQLVLSALGMRDLRSIN